MSLMGSSEDPMEKKMREELKTRKKEIASSERNC